jgi:hypothetical protein
MSSGDPRIEKFLTDLKAGGRSTPDGRYWHEFYQFLVGKKQHGQTNPPVPLILAASGESNASKHHRLSTQLEWALENGCIDEALRYLKSLPAEKWNSCSPGKWFNESYPSFEE